MQFYLVGGAVRDQLLGVDVHEKDWVVVGATPEALTALGYVPVGKDFPVFLHPSTKEEDALARTERKTGRGYAGFCFYTDPSITLEQDLARRDLTINAMAQDSDGQIIDPFGGQKDLRTRTFRHVSPAFCEDPVRILRLARFASRFADFNIHPSTITLLKKMVADGEAHALVAERVWQELKKALDCEQPHRFFTTLITADACAAIFPEIAQHPDGITALQNAKTCTDPIVKLAIVLQALPLTEATALCQRLRIPKKYQSLALQVIKQCDQWRSLAINDAAAVADFLKTADAVRQPERFAAMLHTFTYCFDDHPLKQTIITGALQAVNDVSVTDLVAAGFKGPAFAEQLQQKKIHAIEVFLSTQENT